MGDDCHAALSELQVFLDGECEMALERAILAHLRNCQPCLHRADFERELRVIIATKCRDSAPTGLLNRVLLQLRTA